MNDDTPGDLIGSAEAARLIRVQPRTLRGWIYSGKLRGWRLAGSRILVSKADVLACLRPVPLKPRPVIIPSQRAVAARKRSTIEILRKAGFPDYA